VIGALEGVGPGSTFLGPETAKQILINYRSNSVVMLLCTQIISLLCCGSRKGLVDANANIPKRPDELLSSLGQPVDTSEMQRITQVCQEGVTTSKEFHVK
jgi:hypothetical protein